MNEDWCLSSPTGFSGGHNVQLWDHNKPYSCLGGQGAGGMGYGAPASVGAALAAKSRGRIVINIQTDGDLNYAPGVLWTAAHHRIPLLVVMLLWGSGLGTYAQPNPYRRTAEWAQRPASNWTLPRTAWGDPATPYRSKGPTGVAVRTLVEFIERSAQSQ